MAGSSWISAANALTLTRLLATPVCGYLVLEARDLEAVMVFALAVATDFADGPMARKFGGSSAFGALLDHGTDALFVIVGLAALVSRGFVPALLPPLIGLAFIQYTLDSQALAGQRLRASALGRWNGILYFVLLGTPIIRNSLGWSRPSDATILLLGWLLLAATAASMVDRLLALRRARNG
ncbi:MAG: CDP-alcohol phosphatidyltransferase family protein [Deltaproteobacteria bacterium]|nr:CDP-alcohol phosphatidyltransferase family protein [Deltaproteobacteria bacterium]